MTRKKVLIIDDNPVILKALSLKLAREGFDALIAEDGAEAVCAVRSQRPDLILVDITFPPDVANGGGVAWDGFLIMDWLRRFGEASSIPFIVVTSSDPEKFEKRARAAGAVGFFQKPVDHDQLISAIHRTLNMQVAA